MQTHFSTFADVEGSPIFGRRQFSHGVAEPRLNLGLGEQFPGAFFIAEQCAARGIAWGIFEAAGHFRIRRFIEAHSRFVVLGAIEPVELLLHGHLDALELALECLDIDGCVVVVGDVAGGGRQVVEDAGARADSVLQFGELLQNVGGRSAHICAATPVMPEPQNSSRTRSPGSV